MARPLAQAVCAALRAATGKIAFTRGTDSVALMQVSKQSSRAVFDKLRRRDLQKCAESSVFPCGHREFVYRLEDEISIFRESLSVKDPA